MKRSRPEQFKLAEEAALWLVRLGENPTAQARAEFFDWVRQSPRHMEEFMFAKAVSQQLDGMDSQRKIELDLSMLAGLGRETETGLLPTAPPQRQRRNRRTVWMTGIAASIALVAVAWTTFNAYVAPAKVYRTNTGDQQSIKLRDGSVMQLNTHSRAQVRIDESVRDIHLFEGEALFVVERDPVRPFRVFADGAAIQAVGTQFNVYRRPEGTRVSVLEGAVQITHHDEVTRLEAGTEANIAADRIVRTEVADISRAVSWRARRLVFHSDRLEEVAREFNRYNRRPIRLEDAATGERRISGVFDADDTQPLVEFLKGQSGFEVVQTEEAILIRRPGGAR